MDDILKSAENYLNATEARKAVEMLKEFVPTIVSMNKSIYEEMLKQGFSEQQAFSFSCEYTLKTIFQGK